MYSESVRQVARSWMDVGSFHKLVFGVVYFALASVREFLDTPTYNCDYSIYSLNLRTFFIVWPLKNRGA
jgi:hypothetical protein